MKISNNYNLDKRYVKALESDYQYKDKRYSVTETLRSPREAILIRRHNDEIVQDVAECVWLFFGTAFHEKMEKLAEDFVEVSLIVYEQFKDLVKEQKTEYDPENDCYHYFIKPTLKEEKFTYACKNSPYTLSGITDCYNVLSQEITDYKTASVWKVIFRTYDEYIEQIKKYAFLVSENGYPCFKGKVDLFLKDWNKREKEKTRDSYPDTALTSVAFEVSYGDIVQTKKKVEDYFVEIERCEKLADDDLPLCSKENRTFNRGSQWKVYKIGQQKAVKASLTSYEEAMSYMKYKGIDETTHYVKEQYEEAKCKDYCSASAFCSYYVKNYASYVLVDPNTGRKLGYPTKEKALTVQRMVHPNYILQEVKKEIITNED